MKEIEYDLDTPDDGEVEEGSGLNDGCDEVVRRDEVILNHELQYEGDFSLIVARLSLRSTMQLMLTLFFCNKISATF